MQNPLPNLLNSVVHAAGFAAPTEPVFAPVPPPIVYRDLPEAPDGSDAFEAQYLLVTHSHSLEVRGPQVAGDDLVPLAAVVHKPSVESASLIKIPNDDVLVRVASGDNE